MTDVLTPGAREAMQRELRGRILDVLPAATYQMDRFLSLVDVALSDRTDSAAMECGLQPVLHLNADFVATYCRRNEHLLMLVLHELYHLFLGHTRLFPRLREAHNIAFDAVINALLCQQFPDPVYREFFETINPPDAFPGRLLRPPAGWPERAAFAEDAGGEERRVMSILYGPRGHTVTYQEVLALLEGAGAAGMAPGGAECGGEEDEGAQPVLLGDHGGRHGEGATDAAAGADAAVTGVLRRVAGDWPAPLDGHRLRGLGGSVAAWLAPKSRSPKAAFLQALGALLRAACVLPPGTRAPYGWKVLPATRQAQTVVPNLRDRQHAGRRALLGVEPVLFATEAPSARPRWAPRDVTHVYVDVSGSMDAVLPWLLGGLDPLHRRGLCRLYAFSTIVDEVARGRLLTGTIKNTGGTDITCVYRHLLAFPARATPGKIVVLTDGYTGTPRPEDHREARRRKVQLIVGLIGGCPAQLAPFADRLERLPAWR